MPSPNNAPMGVATGNGAGMGIGFAPTRHPNKSSVKNGVGMGEHMPCPEDVLFETRLTMDKGTAVHVRVLVYSLLLEG